MDFFQYYNGLPTKADQKVIRDNIIERCKIKKPTFWSWLQRGNIPDEKAQLIISQLLGRPQNELFNQNL